MDKNRPLTEHLEELRRRLLYCVAGVLIASLVSFFFHRPLLDLVKLPMRESLIFIAPQEAFLVAFRISVLSGLVISFPFIFYHLWKFVETGLKPREKKFIVLYIPAALILFGGGVLFAFTVVFPAALNFLLGFGGDSLTPTITVDRYVSFSFTFILAFGVMFQLPLVMRMLTSAGIIEKENFKNGRKYAVVLIFICAALLTPPDIFSQLALALPSLFLYEAGLLICRNRGYKSS